MSDLQRAINKVETAIDSAITPAGIYIEPVLEAARLVANPNYLAAHKELDIWAYEAEGIRTSDEAIRAIVAAALTRPGDTEDEIIGVDGEPKWMPGDPDDGPILTGDTE